jgi:hypothetical protein
VIPRSGGTVLVLVLEGIRKGIADENEDDDEDDAWARGDDRIGGETRRTRRPSLSPLARLRLNAAVVPENTIPCGRCEVT